MISRDFTVIIHSSWDRPSSADCPYSNANEPLIHSSSINTDIPIFLLAGSDQSGGCEGRGQRQQPRFWGSAAALCLLQAHSPSSSSCSRRLNRYPPVSREDTRCRPVRSGRSTPKMPSVCMRSSEKVSD